MPNKRTVCNGNFYLLFCAISILAQVGGVLTVFVVSRFGTVTRRWQYVDTLGISRYVIGTDTHFTCDDDFKVLVCL